MEGDYHETGRPWGAGTKEDPFAPYPGGGITLEPFRLDRKVVAEIKESFQNQKGVYVVFNDYRFLLSTSDDSGQPSKGLKVAFDGFRANSQPKEINLDHIKWAVHHSQAIRSYFASKLP